MKYFGNKWNGLVEEKIGNLVENKKFLLKNDILDYSIGAKKKKKLSNT
jgi:hypothetical protein